MRCPEPFLPSPHPTRPSAVSSPLPPLSLPAQRRTRFCYVCLADIRGHGDYFSCARRPIDEKFAQAKDKARAQVLEETWFSNAITAQRSQAKQARESLPKVLELRGLLLANIGEHLLPFAGLAFLEEAVLVVARGRDTLFHALIHARTVPTGTAYQRLFEDAQAQFEGQLGRLTSLVSEAEITRVLQGGGSPAALDAARVAAHTPEALAAARERQAETDFERFLAWKQRTVNLAAATKKVRASLLDAVRFRDFGV